MSESQLDGGTIGEEYPEVVQLLRAVEEDSDLDQDLVDEVANYSVADLDSPQSLTNIENLRDMLARVADSVVSCMYDIIDNGLSAQLSRAYLLETESGESAKVDIHLELDEERDIVWFRVLDRGRGIEPGELITALFGGGRSAGDGLLNHFGVGLLVALCYFEQSVHQHSPNDPDWLITTKADTEENPRRVTGPVDELDDIEEVTQEEWEDWPGQMDPAETGTRVEIPIPFDHIALELESNENVEVDELDGEPGNKYLMPYAQDLRRRLGRDYRSLLEDEPFVQDDKTVTLYFGWEDNFYKSEQGSSGSLYPETACRVVPLSPEFESPPDHIEYDWPEKRVMHEVSWESEDGEQEALYNLELGFIDEAATAANYDLDRDDVDERQFGGTKILNNQGSLGNLFHPSKPQQGVTITILGRTVAPNNVSVLEKTRNNELNYVFGHLDIVPKEGSDVPAIMKAHKQDIEEGGAAWESIKSLFDDLPVTDLERSNWTGDDGSEVTDESPEEETTSTHDQRKEQTHKRFEEMKKVGAIDKFEKELPTSGYKTDNIGVADDGVTEVVEQKDGKMKPNFAYKKIGELLELAREDYDVDRVQFRVDGITENNESALQRGIATLSLVHGVEVQVTEANDDAELDSDDREITSVDPDDIDPDDIEPVEIGSLFEALDGIEDVANRIDIDS